MGLRADVTSVVLDLEGSRAEVGEAWVEGVGVTQVPVVSIPFDEYVLSGKARLGQPLVLRGALVDIEILLTSALNKLNEAKHRMLEEKARAEDLIEGEQEICGR